MSQVCISFPTQKKLFLLFGAALVFAAAVEGRVTAQAFNVLHNFATAANGAYPIGALTLYSNVLYGVTGAGGPAGNGAIFKLQTDGTGFTNFYNFSTGTGPLGTNTDGGSPNGGLVLSGNTLYGTALSGGAGAGTVYRINTDGAGFTNLHSFVFSDGEHPNGDLLLLGNTLYGTTAIGGVVYANAGTIFAVNTDGTGYTNLHVFTALGVDGGTPYSGLIASGSTLYGATTGGGATGFGVVYSIQADGSGYMTLHSFPGPSGTPQTQGIYPYSTLVLADNTLYGTTYQGGDAGEGLVFSLSIDGANYSKLHDFTDASTYPYTNNDGVTPQAGLVLSGDTLYGTCRSGGTSGYGTLFAIKTNGTSFNNLHSMGITDGIHLQGALALRNNMLFGVAFSGSTPNPNGDVFSLSLATPVLPELTIALNGINTVLTWPTSAPGFTLQSTPDVGASGSWNTNISTPVIVNGYYTVTNSNAGQKQFYRLIQ